MIINNEKLGLTFCYNKKEKTQNGDVFVVDFKIYKLKYNSEKIEWEDFNGLYVNDISLAFVFMEGEFKVSELGHYSYYFVENKQISNCVSFSHSIFIDCSKYAWKIFEKEVEDNEVNSSNIK